MNTDPQRWADAFDSASETIASLRRQLAVGDGQVVALREALEIAYQLLEPVDTIKIIAGTVSSMNPNERMQWATNIGTARVTIGKALDVTSLIAPKQQPVPLSERDPDNQQEPKAKALQSPPSSQ